MLSLILAAIFFAGIHLGIAGTAMRDRAIGILGKNGYMAAFAVASVIGLGWLVVAYNRAPYLVIWGMLEWWKPIAIILMVPAALLVAIGLTTPNPTSVAQEGRLGQPPQGIVRITRHPFLTGVGLWALVHLIGNGDLASLVFFATWAIVALAGTVSIDAKRRRLLGRRLGAICGPDVRCSVRSHRCGAESLRPQRDWALALGHSASRLCADAGRTRANHRRIAIPGVDVVTLPKQRPLHATRRRLKPRFVASTIAWARSAVSAAAVIACKYIVIARSASGISAIGSRAIAN